MRKWRALHIVARVVDAVAAKFMVEDQTSIALAQDFVRLASKQWPEAFAQP
jgi:hypothetical protein